MAISQNVGTFPRQVAYAYRRDHAASERGRKSNCLISTNVAFTGFVSWLSLHKKDTIAREIGVDYL